MSRLLAVIRSSVLRADSASPERQRADIESYASAHDHRVAGVASDIAVSAGLSPWDRPQLGAWLRRPGDFDILACAKLDRLVRSLRDFVDLSAWLDEHGAALVCLDPAIDMTTPTGRAFGQILAVIAELERAMTRARIRAAYHALQQQGSYVGGPVPFGYQPVHREGKGWTYEPDPEYGPVLTDIVARVLAGQSLRAVAAHLNRAGVPTSRNLARRRSGKPEQPATWNEGSLRQLIRSPAITGAATAGGELLRDDQGAVVQRCTGIVSFSDWRRVRALGRTRASNSNGSPLLRVAFCGTCGAPLYATSTSTTAQGRKPYRYYRCGGRLALTDPCRERSIRADKLEAMTRFVLLDHLGEIPMREKVVTDAVDHAGELADVAARLDQLAEEYARGGMSADAYGRATMLLESRQAVLRAQPVVPESVEWVATGRTFGEHWELLDDAERRSWLRGAGVRVLARHAGDDPWPSERMTSDELHFVLRSGPLEVIVELGDLAEIHSLASQA